MSVPLGAFYVAVAIMAIAYFFALAAGRDPRKAIEWGKRACWYGLAAPLVLGAVLLVGVVWAGMWLWRHAPQTPRPHLPRRPERGGKHTARRVPA